jgi:hypothetical protein
MQSEQHFLLRQLKPLKQSQYSLAYFPLHLCKSGIKKAKEEKVARKEKKQGEIPLGAVKKEEK